MIKAYKDYWKGYADFAGRTSVGGYWFAVLAHLLVTFVLSFVVGILGQRGSTQTVTTYLTAFELLCILPSLAIVVRRLRDAGCSWTNLFWMFLPIAGPIILIVKLCKPSATSTPSTLSTNWTTGAELGPWRIPAAILLLWGTLTVLASVISARMLPTMNIFWWLLRLSLIALVVLIFIGKKNAGLLIPSGLVFLLSLRGLILTPAIANLLSTAGWAAACLVMALAIFRKKSPPAVLLYLPSGLFLALGIYLIVAIVRINGFFVISDSTIANVLWALAFFCMAKALAEEPRIQPATRTSTGGSSFSSSPQPQPRQPYAPTGYTAPSRKNPGVLLVRFSIEKLNNLSGSYGFQSGKLIGQAVPAALLEGMTISDGDSAATLAGREYVCVVSIASDDISILTQKIEPLLQASKEIRENGAPPITQVVGSTREPLVVDGVVRNGKVEGSGGWCANGLMNAWKEAAERSAEAAQESDAAQPQNITGQPSDKDTKGQVEPPPAEQSSNEASDTSCNHEWIPVHGEWTEKCTRCSVTEPAKFRQREAEILFPMTCVSDMDMDVILTALQFKYMVRTAVDGAQNEFRRVYDKLRDDREYMLNKDEWNSVFLSLTTYASTLPAACPPMFASQLKPEKQQHIKSSLFEKWMSIA